ncbi:MAG TPA: 3-methyl-2-oxobutanoate hydroxymethyltransferase [Gemmatimonadaceae bacterium]|nr:3-methyl-2-oxobutanoate hydroxymethyltransferase [Gemmatimonadaceae bacterium]
MTAGESAAVPRRLTIAGIRSMKGSAEPIVMVTAYDFATAQVVERAGVDLVLVGDSAAMVVLGYETTRLVSVDEMLMLTRAARRGAPASLIVGDLPFGTYESGNELAVATARRFADAGCDAVKMEGGGATVERARAVMAAGIPVMGHVGLTPQQTGDREGFRVHGRTVEGARDIIASARALDAAGCFAIVAEAMPAPVARAVTERVRAPVIGIGAGPSTDGQVLVFHDLVGLYDEHVPRYVKRYAEVKASMVDAVTRYAADVRARSFPGAEHVYRMEAGEEAKLAALLGSE